MYKFYFLMVLFLFGWINSALAGQSADLVCIKSHTESNGDNTVVVCDTYELRVSVSADGDTGQPGAYGIGVQLTDGRIAYWTVNGGFAGYSGGEIAPVEGYYNALPYSRDFVVYRGSAYGLCSLSMGQDFKLYAGHGILTSDKAEMVRKLMSGNQTMITGEHFRSAAIQQDARMGGPSKGGIVYIHSCTATSNNN